MKGYIEQRVLGHPTRLAVIRYTGALFAPVVGGLLAFWLQSILDASVVLLMAILVAAWFSGFWPALLASVLATMTLDYFFEPPLYTLTLEISHIPHLIVFALVSAVFVSISASRRRAERSLKQARDELEVKVRERTADLTAAHAAAVAAQERFRDLVNSIEGIVWESDAQTFRFTFVSQQAARILGYPVEQWLDQPAFWKDHIHPDDREYAVNQSTTATAERRDHDFEYRMIAADGRIVWLRDLVSVVVENDQASTLRGVMLDITARKQADEALREQANLLDLTHDTIFVRDMNDVIRYWNRGAEELYGWTREEALGHVSHDLMQTALPAPLERISMQVLEEGRWEGELVHTKRDGSHVVVASRWSLQRGAEGQPIGILETNNDITERKRAEDKLRRSEASLAEAQRLSHIGSWVEDLVRGTFTASPELLRITGYPEAAAATPDMLRRRIHPDDHSRIEGVAARSQREKTDFEFEHRIVLPDGSIRHVHTIGHPVVDESGDLVEIVGTVADVTERKRTEDALRASEEQWKAVFENNPTMYFMVDPLGTVLSVNPFGADQLGYTVHELIGQSVLNVFAESDWNTVQRMIEACLEHLGRVVSWEIRKVRRDDSLIWVRETAKAMRRIDGSPVVLVACEDITLRKRAEADLQESERRHRHIFHATGVSIWEVDFSAVKAAIDALKAHGVHDLRDYLKSSPEFIEQAVSLVRVVDVNEATLKLFGASSKEELLVSLHKVFTPETRDVFAGELVAIAEGKTAFEGETVLSRLNGDRMAVVFSVSFPPPDAAFDAALVSILDITDRKRAEQELEELAGRLIHAQEQERGRIGRELHDHISQMLGVLTIRMDQLRADDATPPAVAAALEELRQGTAEITDDIHGLSHRLHSSTLDYLGLAPALQKLVNEFSARHGIAIDFEHDALPSPLASDVALCLFRVTEESLANIARHSHARSARVRVSAASDGLHLTVEDWGRGFDLDGLERRAGLGFVSMRERLRVLRGTVRVDSAPSRGTRIDVWVPATSLAPVATGEAAHGTVSPAKASSNVSSA